MAGGAWSWHSTWDYGNWQWDGASWDWSDNSAAPASGSQWDRIAASSSNETRWAPATDTAASASNRNTPYGGQSDWWGSRTKWEPRGLDTPGELKNHRKQLIRKLGRAEAELITAYEAKCVDPYLAECEQSVTRSYSMLFFKDRYHLLLRDRASDEPHEEPQDLTGEGPTVADLHDGPEPESRKGGGEDERRKRNEDTLSGSWSVLANQRATVTYTAAASAPGTVPEPPPILFSERQNAKLVPDPSVCTRWSSRAIGFAVGGPIAKDGSVITTRLPTPEGTFRLYKPHEVLPEADFHWNPPVLPDEWTMEQKYRELRNSLMKVQLALDRPVEYIADGWSMHPPIQKGDKCVFEPVNERTAICLGDVLFCHIQPRNIFIAHWVVRIESTAESSPKYHIGDRKGKPEGWCRREHIYGKLCQVTYIHPPACVPS